MNIKDRLRLIGHDLGTILNQSSTPQIRGHSAGNIAADALEAADHIEKLEAERDELKHDIERYVSISSEQATELEQTRAESRLLRGALEDIKTGNMHAGEMMKVAEEALNTTAPTEAEIRADEREKVADRAISRAKMCTSCNSGRGAAYALTNFANELRGG